MTTTFPIPEKQIQNFYAWVYNGRGLNPKREVRTPAGVVDIVCDDKIVEIKHVDNWIKGLGQLLVYGMYFPRKNRELNLFGVLDNEVKLELIRKHCRAYDIEVVEGCLVYDSLDKLDSSIIDSFLFYDIKNVNWLVDEDGLLLLDKLKSSGGVISSLELKKLFVDKDKRIKLVKHLDCSLKYIVWQDDNSIKLTDRPLPEEYWNYVKRKNKK